MMASCSIEAKRGVKSHWVSLMCGAKVKTGEQKRE